MYTSSLVFSWASEEMKRDWKSPEVRKKPSRMNLKFKQSHGYEARKAAEKDIMAAKEAELKLKTAFKSKRAVIAKNSLAKAERKKNTEIQKGNIQIIKSTKKLRKYDRKAMDTVFKMSHEQIEALTRR